MMVLLEEPLEDKFEGRDGKEVKTSHEYIDELVLPFQVDELDILNNWFDKFDAEICIPNEGHIKYEISSDGLIVLMVGKEIESVVAQVRKFVEDNQTITNEEEEEENH